jgi:hypothetical protein
MPAVTEPEAPERALADLTPEERAQVLHHLRSAALHRARQWDHELAIESILGRELELDIEFWASGIDAPADDLTAADITLIADEDLALILEES